MRNLHLTFVLCTASQRIGGDFAKCCGLLRIYELYWALVLDYSLVNIPSEFSLNLAHLRKSQWGEILYKGVFPFSTFFVSIIILFLVKMPVNENKNAHSENI